MKFTQAIFDDICESISNGESLRSICLRDDMPDQRTVHRWLVKDDGGALCQQYAHAREVQADTIFDEILDIADDAANDWMERTGEDSEGWQLNGEHIQRSRVRIDARKWMAGKLRPKKYGDKLAIGGDNEMDPIKTEETGQAAAKLATLLSGIAERSGTTGNPAGE